jgi:arabinose-5-phosphate isomerase
MTLLTLRGFSKDDYGRLHPGGAIGKAVTLQVADIMRTGDRLVKVSPETPLKETLLAMTEARSGSAAVIDSSGKLLGIFTDGDFRRHIEGTLDILEQPVQELMTREPTSVKADDLAVEIIKIVEKRHIDDIPVVDNDGSVVGFADNQDLPGLKLK